jgi:hypothetical protein
MHIEIVDGYETSPFERLIDNGEIWIKPARYGGGWMCMIVMTEDMDGEMHDLLGDMNGGDTEMIGAERVLNDAVIQLESRFVFVNHASTPERALSIAKAQALHLFGEDDTNA